jgi:hypothetical protein
MWMWRPKDVETEDELALGHPSHRLDEVDVTLPLGHFLVLVTREGVSACACDDGVRLAGGLP